MSEEEKSDPKWEYLPKPPHPSAGQIRRPRLNQALAARAAGIPEETEQEVTEKLREYFRRVDSRPSKE